VNRSTLTRFLRLAAMWCVLLSCLIALQTPALAIVIYDTFGQISFSTPGSIPSGASISFLPGFTSPGGGSFQGNAFATAAASVSPPGTATVSATGFAIGPVGGAFGPSGFANSGAQAITQASLINLNATTVTFPFTLSFSRHSSASTIPVGGQREEVISSSWFSVLLDNTILFQSFADFCSSPVSNNCFSSDSGSDAFLYDLAPGSHFLQVFAFATGFAVSSQDSSVPSPTPTPEPATLILFGTTAAGIALARWRARGRKREVVAQAER
jgi:hypothetical protein